MHQNQNKKPPLSHQPTTYNHVENLSNETEKWDKFESSEHGYKFCFGKP